MKHSDVLKISKDLLPKREEYLNSIQLIAECRSQNIAISRKTLHNHIQDGLLPQGAHVGQEVLFHKEFFLAEIISINLLKSIFHVSYKDLKELAKNRFANFQDIVAPLNSIIFDLKDKNTGKGKNRPLLVNLANEAFLQEAAELFLEKIKKGTNPEKMDTGKFIEECFDRK